MVSIFPIGNSDKNTTRFMQYWNLVSLDTATLTATVAANQITIGGTVGTPQAVLITYNGINYGYEVLISDTTSTIAAALAALIPTATAVANVITIAGQIDSLRAVVVVSGLAALEVKRQSKLFYVSVYTPNPDFRDAIADAIDVVLGQAKRLNFPDTTQALITYKGANEQDTFEKNIIYQRDLVYTIEYPTMMYDTYTTIESIHADIEVTPNL
jgi:phage tail sheath gpL-like